MLKKKIIIVTAGFYPMNTPRSFRSTELAREFARKGHDVVVVLPFRGYDYSKFETEAEIKFIDIGDLRFRSIEFKGSGLSLLIKRVIRRLLKLLFEYPDIELMFKVSKVLRYQTGFDLMISVAVPFPIHWGVALSTTSKLKVSNRWIADCGDPYMGCETDSFKKLFYFKYLEKWFCRKCDFISIPFDGLKDKFYPEFKQKMLVIPQGFRLEDITLADKIESSIPTFAFSGSLIPGIRDLDLFFKVLMDVGRDFRFIVFTNQLDYFSPYKRQLGECLVVNGYMPRLSLLYELSKCDFLVNVDTIYDCKSVSTAFPSKLIDYAFTRRPIFSFCSNSVDKSVLLEFLRGDYSKRRIIDYHNYDIKIVTQKFLDVMN